MSRTAAMIYPEPNRFLREADEDQVVRWIGGWLMDAAPEGWLRVDLTVRLSTMVEEIVVAVVMPDGSVPEIEAPPDVSPLLYELRQKKYMRGRGTWLSLRMTVEPSGDYRITYNFDLDPMWDPPVDAEAYREDFEVFGREDEWVPEWYRERVNDETTDGKPRPDEPTDLLRDIATHLRFALPPGWDHLRFQFRGIGAHDEYEAVVRPMVGAEYPWTPPEHVLELFRRHRAASISDDRGTWLSVDYEIRFPHTVTAKFDSDEDPGYRQSPPAAEFAEELSRYPRSERRTPDWLRERAAES